MLDRTADDGLLPTTANDDHVDDAEPRSSFVSSSQVTMFPAPTTHNETERQSEASLPDNEAELYSAELSE